MFVAVSRFEVANGMSSAVKDAFRNRPGLVDRAPGFVRLDVISPQDRPDEIWLLTYWDARASYERWHAAHRHESHRAMPKGLKLNPRATALSFFEHIAS